MTKLTRPVKRAVEAGSRELIVVLTPGGGQRPALVEVREKGRRAGYAITVGSLFVMLAMRAADPKRAARKMRRRGVPSGIGG